MKLLYSSRTSDIWASARTLSRNCKVLKRGCDNKLRLKKKIHWADLLSMHQPKKTINLENILCMRRHYSNTATNIIFEFQYYLYLLSFFLSLSSSSFSWIQYILISSISYIFDIIIIRIFQYIFNFQLLFSFSGFYLIQNSSLL